MCKARAAINQQTTPIHMCATCGRGFHTPIGLTSHLWTQQLQEQLGMSWSSSTPKEEQHNAYLTTLQGQPFLGPEVAMTKEQLYSPLWSDIHSYFDTS